mmetsp:Transcript_8305/g.4459  ORF Transcript_8305/g.4459 Transcript_8305/m.4459 type:complete len:96 (+) Transcript_8305:507-794(+)
MKDTKSLRHEDIRVKEQERRTTLGNLWQNNMKTIGKGVYSYLTDFTNLATLAGGLTLVFFGWQFAKSSTKVVSALVEARIGKPVLVRETSRATTL